MQVPRPVAQPAPWTVVRTLLPLLLIGIIAGLACGSGGGSGAVRIERVSDAPSVAAAGVASPPPAAPDKQPVTVFIDAGHGGSDPGWGSQDLPGVPPEKILNLDVARRTAAYLEADGFRVVLSRSEDIQVNDPKKDLNGDGCIDPIDEIQARIDMANAAGAAVLLSIHFNGQPGSQLSGSGTYYNAVREFGDQNKRLAELIQAAQLRAFAGFGHQARDWGAVRDDSLATGSRSECLTSKYFALLGPQLPGRPRPSAMPGVIAEALFLTFPKEGELAARAEVRDALAKAYAEALKEFLRTDHSSGAPEPARADAAAVRGRVGGPSSESAAASTGPALLVERATTDRRVVALTFDAGAGAGYTAAILEVLARRGIRATFGLTGAWCEANPELARRITAAGHAVINHTYSHASWTGRSPRTKPLTAAQRQDEIRRAERSIEQHTGFSGRPFFRSPYGDEDAAVQRDLGAMGYRYNVLWSFDSNAWRGARAEEIIARGIKAAAPGAIYVFHVAEQQDALALDRLIEGIAAAGYGFVAVPQLFDAE